MYNDLEKGDKIIYKNHCCEIISLSRMFKGRGQSVLQVKLKDLINGSLISTTFHPGDKFREPEIKKISLRYIYTHQGKFVFSDMKDVSKRFQIDDKRFSISTINRIKNFLKPNDIAFGIFFKEKLINIIPNVKVVLRVIKALPKIKGERAEAGKKTVTLETGLKIKVPLFIEQNDLIEINTEQNKYVRRITL